jgi:hypothetical protein
MFVAQAGSWPSVQCCSWHCQSVLCGVPVGGGVAEKVHNTTAVHA